MTLIQESIPQEPYLELLKCRNDFFYFVENYVKIIHPTAGIVPLEIHDFQRKTIKAFEEQQHNVLVKFRNGGLTTYALLHALWKAMFYPNCKYYVVSKTRAECVYLGEFLDRFLELMPAWLQPKMDKNSRVHKRFSVTQSCITFGTAAAMRGVAVTNLIIDEAAFYFTDKNWLTARMCMQCQGKSIIISTTNGLGNWFYDIYNDAQKKLNSFHIVDVSYKDHPMYTESQIKQYQEILGPAGFQQEVLGNFLGCG